MFVRALVLTVLIMCTVASTLPLSDSLAHWASRPSAARRHKGHFAHRHSRAWWRRYRARLRRQRAAAAQRRRRRRTATMTAAGRPTSPPPAPANHARATTTRPAGGGGSHGGALSLVLPGVSLPSTASLASILPLKSAPVVPESKDALKELPRPAVSSPLPSGWSNAVAGRAGEMSFNVRGADGRARSSAVWSRVNVQAAAPSASDSRNKTFGGVPVTLLRRTVINRMVAEGGWVINDMHRQFGERPVFVVTAQSIAAGGERRAWTFYFTESNGQVYSLATNAPAEFADALAAESEKAVVALGARRAATPTTAQVQR